MLGVRFLIPLAGAILRNRKVELLAASAISVEAPGPSRRPFTIKAYPKHKGASDRAGSVQRLGAKQASTAPGGVPHRIPTLIRSSGNDSPSIVMRPANKGLGGSEKLGPGSI